MRHRSHNAVDIRSWVVGKSADAIVAAIMDRLDVIDETMAGHQKTISDAIESLVKPEMEHLGGITIPSTPGLTRWASRRLGLVLVARYWSTHLLNGKALPRIAIYGAPWETLPDEIHVLDLPSGSIRNALEQSGLVRRLARWITTTALESSDRAKPPAITLDLVESAIHEIRFDPVLARRNPLILAIELLLIRTAWSSPDRGERRNARTYLANMHAAFLPGHSTHVRLALGHDGGRRADDQGPRGLEELVDGAAVRPPVSKPPATGYRATSGTTVGASRDAGSRVGVAP